MQRHGGEKERGCWRPQADVKVKPFQRRQFLEATYNLIVECNGKKRWPGKEPTGSEDSREEASMSIDDLEFECLE